MSDTKIQNVRTLYGNKIGQRVVEAPGHGPIFGRTEVGLACYLLTIPCKGVPILAPWPAEVTCRKPSCSCHVLLGLVQDTALFIIVNKIQHDEFLVTQTIITSLHYETMTRVLGI